MLIMLGRSSPLTGGVNSVLFDGVSPPHHNGQMQPYGTRKTTLMHAYGSAFTTRVFGSVLRELKICLVTGVSCVVLRVRLTGVRTTVRRTRKTTPVRRTPVRRHLTTVRRCVTPVKRIRKTMCNSRITYPYDVLKLPYNGPV